MSYSPSLSANWKIFKSRYPAACHLRLKALATKRGEEFYLDWTITDFVTVELNRKTDHRKIPACTNRDDKKITTTKINTLQIFVDGSLHVLFPIEAGKN